MAEQGATPSAIAASALISSARATTLAAAGQTALAAKLHREAADAGVSLVAEGHAHVGVYPLLSVVGSPYAHAERGRAAEYLISAAGVIVDVDPVLAATALRAVTSAQISGPTDPFGLLQVSARDTARRLGLDIATPGVDAGRHLTGHS